MITELTFAQMETKIHFVNIKGTSASSKVLQLKNGRYVYKEKERLKYEDMR